MAPYLVHAIRSLQPRPNSTLTCLGVIRGTTCVQCRGGQRLSYRSFSTRSCLHCSVKVVYHLERNHAVSSNKIQSKGCPIPDGYTEGPSQTGKYYKRYSAQVTFSEALKKCQDKSSWVVMPKTPDDVSDITALYSNSGTYTHAMT